MYVGKVRIKRNECFCRALVETCVVFIVCLCMYMIGTGLIDHCSPRAYDGSAQWCAELAVAVIGISLIGVAAIGVLVRLAAALMYAILQWRR